MARGGGVAGDLGRGAAGERVARQTVHQIGAVLSEDRLGVELDAAEVRSTHEVDVARLRIGLDAEARSERAVAAAPVVGHASDERVVEPDALGTAAETD